MAIKRDASYTDIGGVQPKLDDGNKQAVSLYGTSTTAGDAAIMLNAGGAVSVTMQETFEGILRELRKMNLQLALITDTFIENRDIDND